MRELSAPRLLLGVLLALSGAAVVPSQVQEIGVYSDATQFASRSRLRVDSTGDVLVHLRRNLLVGIGNPAGAVHGLRATLQDQDLATENLFQFVVLANDGSGLPNTSPAGELLRTDDLSLPAGNGLGAVEFTVTLATPLALPDDDYFVGVGLGPAPTWPSDGLSVHGCSYSGTANIDDPAVPGLVFSIDRLSGQVAAGQRRLHAIRLLTTGAVLLAGADVDPDARRGAPNPNYGLRGAFQDRDRDDGIALRVVDGSRPGTDVVVLGQLGAATVPYRVPGLDGLLYLNPALVFPDLFSAGTTDASGRFETIVLAWPLRLPAPFQLISAQAILDPLGSARMTNLVVLAD